MNYFLDQAFIVLIYFLGTWHLQLVYNNHNMIHAKSDVFFQLAICIVNAC